MKLPSFTRCSLPENIVATTSQEEAGLGLKLLYLPPVGFPALYLRSLVPYIDTQVPILVLKRHGSAPHKLMHEVVADELGHPELRFFQAPITQKRLSRRAFCGSCCLEDLTCAAVSESHFSVESSGRT